MAAIEGLDRLFANFRAYPDKVEKKALDAGLRAGAKVYQDQIRANIRGLKISPNAKRTLRRSLRLVRLRPYRGKAGYAVSIRKPPRRSGEKRDAWYYLFIEMGTQERYRGFGEKTLEIVTSDIHRREVWDSRGQKFRRASSYRRTAIILRRVHKAYTGKIVAQPFIRPAIADAADAAQDAIAKAAFTKLEELKREG